MSSIKIILGLLRCSLWSQSFDEILSENSFRSILKQSKQQTIYGLVFDVLKDKRIKGLPNKKPVIKAMAKLVKIKRQNILINKELAEFVNKCNQQGIDYIVVKGQTLACLYPKPELRQTGDIDFLFPVKSTEGRDNDYDIQRSKIAQIFPSIHLPERMLEYEVGFKHNGILYELHTSLRRWAKNGHQKDWDCMMEKEWQEKHYIEIDGVKVRTLSPTFNAAYVFIHLFFHFMREGVSLRQLCDWMMVLHHYKDEIDKNTLLELLLDLDLFDAYCAFGTILTDYLGLPINEFPMPLGESDRKWQNKILKDIFGGGNFGKLHHQTHNSWKFKMETMRITIRNSVRYYRLCPSEVGGMIPRLIKANLKILLS